MRLNKRVYVENPDVTHSKLIFLNAGVKRGYLGMLAYMNEHLEGKKEVLHYTAK